MLNYILTVESWLVYPVQSSSKPSLFQSKLICDMLRSYRLISPMETHDTNPRTNAAKVTCKSIIPLTCFVCLVLFVALYQNLIHRSVPYSRHLWNLAHKSVQSWKAGQAKSSMIVPPYFEVWVYLCGRAGSIWRCEKMRRSPFYSCDVQSTVAAEPWNAFASSAASGPGDCLCHHAIAAPLNWVYQNGQWLYGRARKFLYLFVWLSHGTEDFSLMMGLANWKKGRIRHDFWCPAV